MVHKSWNPVTLGHSFKHEKSFGSVLIYDLWCFAHVEVTVCSTQELKSSNMVLGMRRVLDLCWFVMVFCSCRGDCVGSHELKSSNTWA